MSHLQGMGSFKSSKKPKAGGSKWGKVKNAAKAVSKPQDDDEDKINRTDEEVAALMPKEPGKQYWVSDPHTVWTQVEVVSHNGADVVVKDALGKERKLDLHFEDCHSCNPRVVDDMTSLHDMHEPGIMFNLEMRASWDQTKKLGEDGQQPYTYVQSVLVAGFHTIILLFFHCEKLWFAYSQSTLFEEYPTLQKTYTPIKK
jgi:hypothetical protein